MIAKAASAAGAQVPELVRLGASGSHPSNAERDLLRLAARQRGGRIELFWTECIMRHPERPIAIVEHCPLLLPHELAAQLYSRNRDRFHELFGTGNLREFWSHVVTWRQPWWLEHPARQDILRTGGEFHIPYKIFGDEGMVGKVREMTIVHWVPVCSDLRETRLTRLPICVALEKTQRVGLVPEAVDGSGGVLVHRPAPW